MLDFTGVLQFLEEIRYQRRLGGALATVEVSAYLFDPFTNVREAVLEVPTVALPAFNDRP